MPPLCFTHDTEYIWEKLKLLERTGWVQWNIPNPETVYEHIYATRALAYEHRTPLLLNDGDLLELLSIIEVHDWPEAITGDVVILGNESNVGELRKRKKRTERQAMETLCENLTEGTLILSLYERYEIGEDKLAQLAKELDKLQAVIQADTYEQMHHAQGITLEFVSYSRKYIHNPYLLSILENLSKKYT